MKTRLALLGLLLLAAGVIAASVGLAWDPSPDSSVTGYYIWYGTNGPRIYTLKHAAGNVTNTTVEGLEPWAGYYFTATAHDDTGLESEYCNEVFYRVPGPKLPPPRDFRVDAL